jgi:exodeoxyribonuclease V gamma subunit
MLLRGVFQDALQNPAGALTPSSLAALYDPRAEVMGRSGLMPVGLFRDSGRRRHLACLNAWHQGARSRGLLAAGPFQVQRFGRASEHERVDLLCDPIALDVPLPGPEGASTTVRVEIHGRTEPVSSTLPGSLTCVTRDEAKSKDFLAGFLDAVVLTVASARPSPVDHQAHILPHAEKGGADFERRFGGIDQTVARSYLTGLLADMFGGRHDYLLPCEAVFDYLEKGKNVAASIDEIKEDGRKSCSSRYGPVRNFALYDPPPDDVAEAMIDRRFGLFLNSGGGRS